MQRGSARGLGYEARLRRAHYESGFLHGAAAGLVVTATAILVAAIMLWAGAW